METMDAFPSFGELLKRYRLAAGLTQEELAEQARLSARAISDHERGARRAPYRDTVRLLAQALRLAPPEQAAFTAAVRRTGGSSIPRPSADPYETGQLAVRALPALVGRTRELAALERHLGEQGPPVLMLAGEPGIGKSRLLHEAARYAVGGWTVLQGGCQRRGGQEPYAPVLDALERYLQARSLEQLRGDLRGCAWLVRLLPELAGSVDEAPGLGVLPPEQERRLMVRAVARFLTNVAGPAGTLLLLDDLQWADADALALLNALVRSRSPGSPSLRVVGAYRDTDVRPQDALAVVLADLVQAELTVQCTVESLQPQEAARLLDDLLDGAEEGVAALRERILQRADAVPFFLVSCAQGLDAGALRVGVADSVPWTLAQSIRQRVVALSEVAQTILGVAAVIGRRMLRALLVAAAMQPEEEVLAGLEAACRAQLLKEDDADAYVFTHDVIREVIEADLGAARRAALHRRVAAALEQYPMGLWGEARNALLAYHYSRSDEQDRTVVYLEQAGDYARAQYANAAAEAYYQDAVGRLDTLGRSLDGARVREKLGAALRTVARYDAALTALEQAAEAYRVAGNGDSLARVMAGVARIHVARVTPEEGVRRFQPLVDTLESHGPSHGMAALYAALAHLYFATGRYPEQLVAAERAMQAARLLDDDRLLAEAEGRRSLALLMLGRPEEALVVSERVTAVAEVVGDLDSLRRALNVAATIYRDRGEFAAARRDIERALAIAERQGDPAQIASFTSHRGEIAFFAGDWDQARVDCERAVALSREIGPTWASPYTLLHLGQLRLAEGAWDAAALCLEELGAMAGHADLRALRQAQGLLAEHDLLRSRPQSAYARLAPLLDRAGLEEWNVIPLLPRLAWAHLELGQVRQAEEVATGAVRRAQTGPYRLALVDALWVRALIAQRRERWNQARRTLDTGLRQAQGMRYPYAEARLLHVYGEVYAQQDAPEEARERLTTALAIMRRLGARHDAERVAQTIANIARR